jgi:hypothetical protein
LPHFKLDVDINLMSAEEQREAATVLLEAAERLSQAVARVQAPKKDISASVA